MRCNIFDLVFKVEKDNIIYFNNKTGTIMFYNEPKSLTIKTLYEYECFNSNDETNITWELSKLAMDYVKYKADIIIQNKGEDMRIEYMKNVIKYFASKYKYNWEDIYTALKNKEKLNKELINNEEIDDNVTFIISDDYPENLKRIYAPPFILFNKGNKKLLEANNDIISIWDDNLDAIKLTINNINDDKVLAFIYDHKFDNFYNKLSASGIKIILSSNTQKPSSSLNINENVCFISEVDFNCMNPSIDIEQTEERICLGISNLSMLVNYNENEEKLDKMEKLFDSEKQRLIIANIDKWKKDDLSFIKRKFLIENSKETLKNLFKSNYTQQHNHHKLNVQEKTLPTELYKKYNRNQDGQKLNKSKHKQEQNM